MKMKFSGTVHKMQTRRRRVRMLAVLRFKAVRRDKASQHDRCMDHQQEPDGPGEVQLFMKSRAEPGITIATTVSWVHSGTPKDPFGNRVPSLRSGLGKKRVHACLLIRGSKAYSSTSPSKFPATRNTVVSMTAPITTKRSRAIMASSSSGPMPGQLMTTSIKSDTLSSIATESPKREISGLAAAGNA